MAGLSARLTRGQPGRRGTPSSIARPDGSHRSSHPRAPPRCCGSTGARQLSPVEATRACLDRIERWNDRVHAFCLVDGEAALAAARASEARWRRGEPLGLLDGVPATIKDLVLTRGWTARRGSHTTAGPPAGRGRRAGHGTAARGRGGAARQHDHARVRLEGASPTTRSATSPATPGTSRARPAARAAAPPSRRRWAWARCTSAPTAAARSASRPASAASSG